MFDYFLGAPISQKARNQIQQNLVNRYKDNPDSLKSWLYGVNDRIIIKTSGLLTVLALLAAVNAELYVTFKDYSFLVLILLCLVMLSILVKPMISVWEAEATYESHDAECRDVLKWCYRNAVLVNVSAFFVTGSCLYCVAYIAVLIMKKRMPGELLLWPFGV